MREDSRVDAAADDHWDPLFIHSRREAAVIFLFWLAGLVWAVPYCYRTGYLGRVDVANLPTVWGIPTWIFWGILVPWIIADVLTIWFCLFYMRDDDLGEAPEEREAAESSASGQEGG